MTPSIGSFQKQLNQYEQLRSAYRLLPVKVSGFYQSKVDEEVSVLEHRDGPLHRVVYPCAEKIETKQPFEVDDFVEDRENMPAHSSSSFIHKYKDRILFMPTTSCLSNCMYCFRQDVIEEKENQRNILPQLQPSLDLLVKYISKNPQIKEVILSGGDPMLLTAKQLEHIFSTLASKTAVKNFRIHSRALIFDPDSVSEKHIKCLAKFNVRLVLHIVHPYELCSKTRLKIGQLKDANVHLFNQFPLVRKINDHVGVLSKLLEELDNLYIRNLSIFLPDPVHYSSTYRINFARVFSLIDQLNQRTPSWINSTRFCQDTVYGKVRPENLKEYCPELGYATFRRGERLIKVPDHPQEYDEAGDLPTMLWKG